jgi:hypothetical protein
MDTVHQATELATGRTVAVTMMAPSLAEEAEQVARFEREAKLLSGANPTARACSSVGNARSSAACRLPDTSRASTRTSASRSGCSGCSGCSFARSSSDSSGAPVATNSASEQSTGGSSSDTFFSSLGEKNGRRRSRQSRLSTPHSLSRAEEQLERPRRVPLRGQ